MSDRSSRPFEDLVLARTGPEFVERRWLHDEVERALRVEAGRYVLVTGEPGAGKTSLLAGMTRAHPDWLRYFVPPGHRDIQSFLLSLGHQLAGLRPEIFQPDRLAVAVCQDVEEVETGGRVVGIRIDDLRTSPFHRTAILKVEQEVTKIAGSVTGVEIGRATLEPRLLEPDNLAQLALIGPAKVLLEEQPEARIVILLDALDELAIDPVVASLLDWLARGPELPPNVRLVMSSRPHSTLGQFQSARADQLSEIVIDPQSRQVSADLLGYAERALGTEAITAAVSAGGLFAEQFQRDAVRRAAGNFLYLSTYARALNDAARRAEHEMVRRLLSLDGLPPGLAGLYAFFVETARADVSRLGMLEIREPTTAADTLTPAWEGVGQPILGVLTVARDWLTVEELGALGGIRVWPRAVRTILDRLRWLLDVRDGRVAFFHSSIGEFLTSEQARRDHPAWAVDEGEWHERIVRHYRGGASTWATVDWNMVNRYGLIHLAEHVIHSRAAIADEVADLVCPGLRRAIRTRLGSDRHFVPVVEVAAARMINRLPVAAVLPTVLYLAVVRRQLLRSSRSLAPAVLGLLARMGRTDEALEYLAALLPSRQQFEGVREILRYTGVGPGNPGRHGELLDLLAETALTIPEGDQEGRSDPLKLAAQELAPHDLRRALRLWDRAHENTKNPDEAPDPVYRAAAAASQTYQAAQLIASIRNGRASDYLDLAARAEPGEVPNLLRQAETSLAAEPAKRDERLRGLARLAAAWARLDLGESRRCLGAVLAEADRGGDDEGEFARGLVEAASALADVERATARHFLDRLESVTVDGLIDRAVLRAASLWAAWGSPDKAQRLLARLIAWNNTVWTKVRAAKVIGSFDVPSALRMIEEAYATIPPARPGQDEVSQLFREGDLETVALALARYDLGRAATVAREMANTSWSPPVSDRYTTLARIAHLNLDAGNVNEATRLLEESLSFIASAPPLVDVRPTGPFRPVSARPEAARTPPAFAEGLMGSMFRFNHTEHWRRLRETRFFFDTAEVISAMTPGSWSIGNPFTWARTVRFFAETIVDGDLAKAVNLVRSLTNSGQRAVGVAAMLRATMNPESIEVLWREFTEAVEGIEHFEWVIPDQDDSDAFAYVRPDHQARFDAAMRIILHNEDAAMRLLVESGTTYLRYAFESCVAANASDAHTLGAILRIRPFPPYQQVHEGLLTEPPSSAGHDMLLVNIVRARAIVNEYLIANAVGQAFSPPVLDDARYAAFVDLAVAESVEPSFIQRIRGVLDGLQLPAAAALVAFAAKMSPAGDAGIRDLCGEIITATENSSLATRAATLLHFAISPALSDLVDPAELFAEALRLPTRWVDNEEVINGLFPVLLTKQPKIALRLLYNAVEQNWDHAMALLEHGAKAIVNALGTDAATILHGAIRRALECTSSDGTAPVVVDGVRLT